MYNFVPEDLTESILSSIMPLWKQHQSLAQKLQKLTAKGSAKLMLDFICSSVEYKLKKDIFNQSTDVSLPETKEKLDRLVHLKDKDEREIEEERERLANIERYINEIEANGSNLIKIRELSREAIRKFHLA